MKDQTMSKRTETAIQLLNASIAQLARRRDWIAIHADLIEQVDVIPSGYDMVFDFDYLTHDKIILVIQLFPGKWEKSLDGEKITYTREEVEGVTIRCYRGEPPPSCKIVEEEVVVPEHVVPETKKLVRKLVCS